LQIPLVYLVDKEEVIFAEGNIDESVSTNHCIKAALVTREVVAELDGEIQRISLLGVDKGIVLDYVLRIEVTLARDGGGACDEALMIQAPCRVNELRILHCDVVGQLYHYDTRRPAHIPPRDCHPVHHEIPPDALHLIVRAFVIAEADVEGVHSSKVNDGVLNEHVYALRRHN
jgi:hypothetical protein